MKKLFLILSLLLIFLTACECPECEEIELECDECNCPTLEELKEPLEVYFINVGHGSSVLLKHGTTEMLIDCGKNTMGPIVVDFLKGKGVKRLEFLMITHIDSEHLGGCDDVLKSFTVQTVITNGEEDESGSYKEVTDEIDEEQMVRGMVKDNWDIGPANIEIIQTNNHFETSDENSLVSRLTYDQVSILFTGDCREKCEDFLLEKNLTTDILQVADHGTKFATEIDFLERVNPSIAIIEVGDNLYGHPAEETLDRLSQEGVQVYRTDRNGNIEIRIDGESYEIK